MVTSELTWLETLVRPLKEQNAALEMLFRDFLLAEEITLLPATLSVWEAAARLRALGLKTPDALHAATAMEAQGDLFLTNDPAFRRVPALQVVLLSEL